MNNTCSIATLRQEACWLRATVLDDCRDSLLASAVAGGSGDRRLRVLEPCARVDDWTQRAQAALEHAYGPQTARLSELPVRRRRSLETDSGYVARCLNERLAAFDRMLVLRARRRSSSVINGWARSAS
jgi:hypothetical protein